MAAKRLPRTPANPVSREELAQARGLLNQRAAGATGTVSVGRGQAKRGVGGSTAYGNRGDLDENAILKAAEEVSPQYLARAGSRKQAPAATATSQMRTPNSPSLRVEDDGMDFVGAVEAAYGGLSDKPSVIRGTRPEDQGSEMAPTRPQITTKKERGEAARVAQPAPDSTLMGAARTVALDVPMLPTKGMVEGEKQSPEYGKRMADRASGTFTGGAPRATVVEPPSSAQAMSSDRIQQVFKAATGGSFDPKSRLDRQRLAEIQSVISSRPELADSNPNKIALAWYKSKKK